MSGELQPFDTERYVEELSRIIGKLGDIATRGSGLGTEVEKLTSEAEDILGILWCATCPDCKEALSDEDAASEQAMQDRAEDRAEEIEFLPENREY